MYWYLKEEGNLELEKPIIYTTIPATVSETWKNSVRVVEGAEESRTTDPHISGPGRLYALKIAWKTFKIRSKADCLVTGGSLSGLIFSLLQSLFPYGRKPQLMMSAIWTYPRNRIELWIRRNLLRFGFRSVCVVFVNTSHEVKAYSKLFKLPEEKFLYLPYCYRLTGYDYTVRDDGYIWSGGNGDRDYKMLINAVREIKKPVIINATRKSLFEGIEVPDHVTVKGVTPVDFRRYMAGCSFAVIPMEEGKLHPGGQQTFLGLMKMGKVVILTDPVGGKDYIENGYNGILVPFGDTEKLREAILFVLNNPDKAIEIGRNATVSVEKNSEDDYMRAILNRAYQEVEVFRNKK